jgi:hypothetical protein
MAVGGDLEHWLLDLIAIELLQQQLFGAAPGCQVFCSGQLIPSRAMGTSLVEKVLKPCSEV